MKLPLMPVHPKVSNNRYVSARSSHFKSGIAPQKCCAETCVTVLGVKKCKCVLNLPICP